MNTEKRQELVNAIKKEQQYAADNDLEYVDMRLRWYDGDWYVHTRLSDSDYDTDHRGYIGGISIYSNCDAITIAHNLIMQVEDQIPSRFNYEKISRKDLNLLMKCLDRKKKFLDEDEAETQLHFFLYHPAIKKYRQGTRYLVCTEEVIEGEFDAIPVEKIIYDRIIAKEVEPEIV